MSRTQATALLAELRNLGIEVKAHKESLRCRPRTALTAQLQARVRAHRAELLDVLANSEAASVASESDVKRGRYVPGVLPMRPCYCCGGREFYRGSSGPEWVCILCHGPWNPDWIAERFVLGGTPSVRNVAGGDS